jgi:hypothetical protein
MSLSGSESPWIILGAGRGGLTVIARDDRGRRVAGMLSDDRVHEFIERASSPLEPGASLPIFTSLPDRTALGEFVAQIDVSTPIQSVRLGRTQWRRRALPVLPIDIVGVGPDPEPAVELIARSDWLQEATPAAAVEPEIVDPAGFADALRAHPRHAVLTGPAQARQAIAEAARMPIALRPRLFLVVGAAADPPPRWLNQMVPPHGVAVVYADATSTEAAAGFSAGVLERIAEDLPLHDAVRLAAQDAGDALSEPPLLIADPGTNEALSLRGAGQQLAERADNVRARLADAGIESLLGKATERRPGRLRLFDYFPISGARYLPDLGEPAEVVEELEEAGAGVSAVAQEADPGDTESPEDRRVDLTVRAHGLAIVEALAPKQRFQVLLRIGRPFPDSRLPEKAPPVAPSLPAADDAGGHDLEIVVYGLDFGVPGRASRPLRLPRSGHTKVVSVPVVAPAQPQKGARLRVAVYCHSYLVQSFLMTADVREDRKGEAPVFTLEFAQSVQFANLDHLPPRVASIAVNADSADSHTVMVKGRGEPKAVGLNADFIEKSVVNFRKQLGKVSKAVTAGRVPPSADPAKREQFAQQWRDLAEFGNGMYDEFWKRFEEGELDLLDEIKHATGDEVVQIVRLDPSFAFPWTLFYDWPLPSWNEGDPPPAFCFGGKEPVADGQSLPARACNHGPDDEVFCVYGFWAVRLRLEQLVENTGAGADAPQTLQGACPVRLGLGVNDAGTKGLDKRLAALTTVRRMSGTTKFLDDLWSPSWRPAEIVAIGHHAELAVTGQPRGSRIQVDGRWLVLGELGKRLMRRVFWETPNSVVLLLACDTSTTSPVKLNDFAFSFLKARAGGVLATELVIRSDLAARCAELVTRSLFVELQSFSTAVRDLHRRFAHNGNPLAFSFVNLGHAELHIAS